MPNRLLMWTLGVLGCLSLLACTEDSRQWKYQMRQSIDSLSRQQILLITDSIDSVCQMHYDALLPRYIDSLVAQRKKEVDDLLQDD